MKSALIGYTGFVGGNLARQREFDCVYNSKNFRDMAAQSYGDVLCAGTSAVKWQAVKDPQLDLARITELQAVLTQVDAERFILISTIDVYPILQGKDETFDCHGLDNHAYGANRLSFEDFCRNHFANCYVVRLPGLFGSGLKKNVIFDLLHNNRLEVINPASSFQYYYLNNLWADIEKTIAADVRLINLFTEPVRTQEIIDLFFPDKTVGQNAAPEVHYDLHTCYAGLWDRAGSYAYGREEILAQMQQYIATDTWETRA